MKRILAGFLTILFVFLPALSVYASGIPNVPHNRAVLDEARVLSTDTITYLVNANDRLAMETGGEIMFLTVNFVPLGQDIENFAADVFNAWGVGSAERNNGILVVIDVAGGDYHMTAGAGIEEHLGGGAVQHYLNTYFRERSMIGDYDTSVIALFNALASNSAIFPVAATGPFGERQTLPAEPGIGSFIPTIVIIFIVLWVVSSISRAGRRGRMMGGPMMPRRGGFGGFMGGLLIGRAMSNRHRGGGGLGGGGFTRGGGSTGGFGGGGFSRGGGYTRGGGGGMRGGGRRR
ncbi:MAG: TPM domain-containing protein [Defluviitaleaceae bacterium]|nr:TPM domain-containing protein [Defluviitaleaceae bacterium]